MVVGSFTYSSFQSETPVSPARCPISHSATVIKPQTPLPDGESSCFPAFLLILYGLFVFGILLVTAKGDLWSQRFWINLANSATTDQSSVIKKQKLHMYF